MSARVRSIARLFIRVAPSVAPNGRRESQLWKRAYLNLIYFNEAGRGNHFAAWQEPTLFTAEVRAAFRSLR